jgi:hypothetical protein
MKSGEVLKDKHCLRCDKVVNAKLVRNITTSGVAQVYWQCPECKRNADGAAHFIKHDLLRQYVIIDSLPIVQDYSKNERCAVRGCENIGAEYHHWAPHHLFPDADSWPTGYLCKFHHDYWHATVTPDMCKVKA